MSTVIHETSILDSAGFSPIQAGKYLSSTLYALPMGHGLKSTLLMRRLEPDTGINVWI